jgi:hypothetical protein
MKSPYDSYQPPSTSSTPRNGTLGSGYSGTEDLAEELRRQQREERDAKIRSTLGEAPNPQKINKSNKIAREKDIPPQVAEDNIELFQATELADRMMGVATQYSGLGKWMDKDTRNVAAVSDDVDNVSALGKAFEDIKKDYLGDGGNLERWGDALMRRVHGLKAAAARYDNVETEFFKSIFPDFLKDPFITVKKQNTKIAEFGEAVQALPLSGETTWEDFKANKTVGNFTSMVGDQGAAMIADMTALIAFPMGYTAARSGEIGQERAVNNGRSEATARDVAIALPAAALSTYMDKIGLQKIFSPAYKTVWGRILGALGYEAATEGVQEFGEYTAATAGTDKGFDLAEGLDQAAAGAAVGGAIGASIRTAAETPAMTKKAAQTAIRSTAKIIQKAESARQGRANAAYIDKLDELMQNNKMRKENPEGYAELLQTLAEDSGVTDVYVPVDELFQMSEEFEPDSPEGLWIAAQDLSNEAPGTEIRIPIERLHEIAGTDLMTALKPNMRLRPQDSTLTEAEAFEAGLDEEIAATFNNIASEGTMSEQSVKLRENIRDRLVATGATSSEATTQADAIAKMYEVRASERGETITGDEFKPTIQQVLPDGVRQFREGDNLDAAISAMRAPVAVDVASSVEDGAVAETGNRTRDTVIEQGGAKNTRIMEIAEETSLEAAQKQLENADFELEQAETRLKVRAADFAEEVGPAMDNVDAWAEHSDKEAFTVKRLASVKNIAEMRVRELERNATQGATETVTPADPKIERAAKDLRKLLIENDLDPETASREEISAVLNNMVEAGGDLYQSIEGERRDPNEVGETTDTPLVNNLASSMAFAKENSVNTGRELKEALQERSLASQKEAGINLRKLDDETAERLADYVVEDAEEALQDNINAVGWYDHAVTAAKKELSKLYPEIATDPESEFAFIWALAVTSNGLKVDKNFALAAAAYEAWKRDGVFPTDIGIGEAAKAINLSLGKFQEIIDRFGSWEAARDFMISEHPVRDIEKTGGTKVSGEGKGEIVRGAAILGPKIGNGFFTNLYGYFDSLTMDRWLMRSVGRWRGTLIKLKPALVAKKRQQIKDISSALTPQERRAISALYKGSGVTLTNSMTAAQIDKLATETAKRSMKPKWRKSLNALEGGSGLRKAGNGLAKYHDGQVEAPAGAKERAFIRQTFQIALARLKQKEGMEDLTMADLQALLWYPEKLLYETAKKPSGEEVRSYEDDEAPDYANAARKLVRDRLGSDGDVRGGSSAGRSGYSSGNTEAEGAQALDQEAAGTSGRSEQAGDGRGRSDVGEVSPLDRAPRNFSGPIQRIVAAAEGYAAKIGISLKRQAAYVEVNIPVAERIAAAYEALKHDPKNPKVNAAYKALIEQTRAQYDALVEAGYTFTFFGNDTDPYDGNGWNALRDLRDNNTMAVYSTMEGYGMGEIPTVAQNPMMEKTGLEWPDQNGDMQPVLANDLFRAVHDAFGHGLEGAGFRAEGEENAWQAHVRLFTGPAVGAITTETRGQNSWLNYGPHGETNRTAKLEDTEFADQKIGLMPEWTWNEGRVEDEQDQGTTLFQLEDTGRSGRGSELYGESDGGRDGSTTFPALERPPVNEDGTITLDHFSLEENLSETDPQRWGRSGGFLSMEEQGRMGRAPNRTYFGYATNRGGYRSEFPEGRHPRYNKPVFRVSTRVPADSLYDMAADPDGLKVIGRALPKAENGRFIYKGREVDGVSLYEHLIKDAGYKGYWVSEIGGSVALFDAVEVQPYDAARDDYQPLTQNPAVMMDIGERADNALAGKAARAIDSFVGMGPNAKKQGVDFGFMNALELEAAFENDADPEIRDAIEEAFAPIREQIRAITGDTVHLFRRQGKVEADEQNVSHMSRGKDGKRNVLSWTSNMAVARFMADAQRDPTPEYTEDEILAREAEFAEKGEVTISGNTRLVTEEFDKPLSTKSGEPVDYFERPEDIVWGKGEMIMIYRGPEAITDTDSVRDFMESENDWRREDIERSDKKRSEIVEKDVSLDQVVWFTDRAGQMEFIVRNEEGVSPFIDQTGDLLYQGTQQQPRGSLQLLPDGQRIIRLFEGSNLSTLQHEMAHYWFDLMAQDVAALDPNDTSKYATDLRARWSAVSQWLKRNKVPLNADGTIPENSHELFARTWEQYLMEGKSPSTAMRKVFNTFRSWMTSIYRSVQSVPGGKISPQIREVFDRMVATEEEIEAGREEQGLRALFDNIADWVGGEKDFDDYVALGDEAKIRANEELLKSTMRVIRQRVNKDYAGALKIARADAEEVVDAMPAIRALKGMRNGDIPKMDRDMLVEMDPDIASTLPAGEPVLKYGGMHPDDVAEMAGFTSGDELVRALQDLETRRKELKESGDKRSVRNYLVETEAQRLINERYGDPLTDGTIEREAITALQNIKQGEVLAAELKQLGAKTNKRPTPYQTAKQWAEEKIASGIINDVASGAAQYRYSQAAAKAGRAAEKAYLAGNNEEAFNQKQIQMVQTALARAAADAYDRIEVAVRRLDKLAKQRVAKTLPLDYLDRIHGLLEDYEFKRQSQTAIDRRNELGEWIVEMEEQGRTVDVPKYLLANIKKTHWSRMTVEDLLTLDLVVQQIKKLGMTKNKLLASQKNREVEQAASEMEAAILASKPKTLKNIRSRETLGHKWLAFMKGFAAIHRKMASFARQMDGLKDNGPVWESLIRPMNERYNFEATEIARVTQKLSKILGQFLGRDKFGRPIMGGSGMYFESIGQSFNLAERMGIVGNMGNEGNLQRLIDGERGEYGFNWTLAQINEIKDSLTKEQMDAVQNIWNLFEEFKPRIAEKERRVSGVEPTWIEPVPLETKHGTYAGGYWPVQYDPRRTLAAHQNVDADEAQRQLKGAYTAATTRRSFTKERADKVVGRPLMYGLSAVTGGLTDVVHDLAFHEYLIDANRLLRHPKVSAAIINHYGPEVLTQFTKGIEDVAQGPAGAQNVFEQGVNHVRMGATIAGLGLNFFTAALQPIGLTQSMVRIGPKWVAKGIANWFKSPAGVNAGVYEKSEFMTNRSATMQREINEIRNRIQGKTKTKEFLDASYFIMITKMQLVVDIPTWSGAYEKADASGVDEATAIALADQAVIDAQGGGQYGHLAAIQRGGPLQKLFTNFYSFFNTTYNLSMESVARTNFKKPGDIMALAMDYLLLYTIPASLGYYLRALYNGAKDDGDDDDESMWEGLISENLSFMMGTMVGLREMTGAVQSLVGAFTDLDVRPYKGSYGGPAGLRALQEIDRLGKQTAQGEVDRALRKSMVATSGVLFHLPSGQINRTWDGMNALIEDETDNPAVLITGS